MRRAFIVPATKSYLSELRVLLCSIRQYHFAEEIFVISPDIAKKELPISVELVSVPADNERKWVRCYRFHYVVEDVSYGEFHSICILDADMVLFRPIHQFFEAAEGGAILVSSNNTISQHTAQDFDQFKLPHPQYSLPAVHSMFCTVPMFLDPIKWRHLLDWVWCRNPTYDDLGALNLIATAQGLHPVYLPSYSWTNIHESMLKPETFVIKTEDGLYSNQGEPVYMLHGHWYDAAGYPAYREQILSNMIRNYGESIRKDVENRIDILKEAYDAIANQIPA